MKPLWHKTPNSPLAILRGEISLQLSEALLQGFHFLKAEISAALWVGWSGGGCLNAIWMFFWGVLGGGVAEFFLVVVLYRSCSSKTSFVSQMLYVLLGRLRKKKAEF